MPKSIRVGWLLLLTLITMAFVPAIAQAVLSPVFSAYDRYFPVVEMRGVVTSQSENSVVIHIWGQKHRECRYLQIHSYALVGEALTDTHIARIDIAENGSTKPVGVFDIGYWRVWPITGASAISVYVHHDCDGRLVVTRIAEVPL